MGRGVLLCHVYPIETTRIVWLALVGRCLRCVLTLRATATGHIEQPCSAGPQLEGFGRRGDPDDSRRGR